MATSVQCLIFVCLALSSVYSAAAAEDVSPPAVNNNENGGYALPAESPVSESGKKDKRYAYVAATAPSPVLAYSSAVYHPAAAPATYYPYAYAGYPSYAYPATTYAAYPSYYANDDGKYWPGKYEKAYYYNQPVYKSAGYPFVYHY